MNIHSEVALYTSFKERLLAEYPDIDDETLSDTLEGCTDLDSALLAALRSARDDEATAAMIHSKVAALCERQKRFAARAERTRAVVRDAMEAAGLKKLTAPDMTVSIRNVPPSVVITDEAALPEMYLVTPPPKPDKKAIKEALAAGVEVPGATLSNGSTTLAIKV